MSITNLVDREPQTLTDLIILLNKVNDKTPHGITYTIRFDGEATLEVFFYGKRTRDWKSDVRIDLLDFSEWSVRESFRTLQAYLDEVPSLEKYLAEKEKADGIA